MPELTSDDDESDLRPRPARKEPFDVKLLALFLLWRSQRHNDDGVRERVLPFGTREPASTAHRRAELLSRAPAYASRACIAKARVHFP